MSIDLKTRAPRFINNTDLWADFLDSVSTEMDNLKSAISEKEKLLDIDSYSSISDLVAISKWFGYNPIRSINSNDLDYLKQDIKSIIFKIKTKGTLQYYRYVFNLIPFAGKTYSLVHDTNADKLWKAIDLVSSSTALDSHDITTPFTTMYSIVDDSYTYNGKYNLDAYLDYLDYYSIGVNRTKHLTFEYILSSVLLKDSTEYLLYDDYFRYLERAIEYGRKITTVPHIGCQLNIRMDNSGYFDNADPGASYSVADLQMQASATNFYDITLPDQITLDDSYTLDSVTQWYLDNDDEVAFGQSDQERFYYMYYGTGTKNLIPTTDTDFYTLQATPVLYLPFDTATARLVKDLSENNNLATIRGSYSYVPAVLSNGLSFNGSDTDVVVDSFQQTYTDTTITFWLQADDAEQTDFFPYIYYHNGVIEINYDVTSNNLQVLITGGSGTVALEMPVTLTSGTNYFVVIELDIDGNASGYINDVLLDSEDMTGTGTINGSPDLYIGSKGGSQYFKGVIDDLRVYPLILTSGQKTYLLNDTTGTMATMVNFKYRQRITDNQIFVDDNRFIVHGWIPSKSVNNEAIVDGDGSTQSFSGTLAYDQVIKKYVTITYTSGGVEYTIVDDGEGDIGGLSGDFATGTIEYDTGKWTITTTNYPDDSTVFYADYKTKNDIQVTEVATANIDGKVTCYATFPPIQFKNELNHLSAHFIIER